MPQRHSVRKARRFFPGPSKRAKKRESLLSRRQGAHCHDLGQHRIAAQMGHPRELVGPGEDAGDEAQRRVHGVMRVGAGEPVRQQAGEQRAHFAQMQEGPKGRLPRVCAQPLLGGRNADGLFAGVQLDCCGHRLVSRSRVALRLVFHYSPTTPRR